MGQENTAPRKINKVEGAAGQGMVSQGPGIIEKWGGKLEWTLNKILVGAGVGSAPTETDLPGGATKEFWVPATGLTELTTDLRHVGYRLDANNEYGCMEFHVPNDFSSIIAAVVARIAFATGTHRLNYLTEYGAVGEGKGTHAESLLDVDVAETNDIIYEQDVSGILSVIAAGDYVGMYVSADLTNVPNDLIIGFRLRYS